MTELITRFMPGTLRPTRAHAGELLWFMPLAGGSALLTAILMVFSLQAALGLVLVVLVIALHEYDRRFGVAAMFALWFLAPLFRRLLELFTGYVNADPLSVAPVIATAAIAGIELLRYDMAPRARRLLILAGVGFTIGLPFGMLHPISGLYTFGAYLAGLMGLVLGFNEARSLQGSTLRWVLLIGFLPIAVYGILQRVLPLPFWDQRWLDSVDFNSIGTGDGVHVRVFASLNAPGTLAPILGLALLCYATVRGARMRTAVGAAIMAMALALTYVRVAWTALAVAAIAHIVVTRGRSARLILGAAAVTAAATVALSPVSVAARSVMDRATTLGSFGSDVSFSDRATTLKQTLPKAAVAPLGHGLGSAGEQSRLDNPSALQTPDDGYLSLIYQIGPVGFALVMAAIGAITAAAWRVARARARGPDAELRVLLFTMLVFFLVVLTGGDAFYGVTGVLFWFICGQILAFDHADRLAERAHAWRAYDQREAAPEAV